MIFSSLYRGTRFLSLFLFLFLVIFCFLLSFLSLLFFLLFYIFFMFLSSSLVSFFSFLFSSFYIPLHFLVKGFIIKGREEESHPTPMQSHWMSRVAGQPQGHPQGLSPLFSHHSGRPWEGCELCWFFGYLGGGGETLHRRGRKTCFPYLQCV